MLKVLKDLKLKVSYYLLKRINKFSNTKPTHFNAVKTSKTRLSIKKRLIFYARYFIVGVILNNDKGLSFEVEQYNFKVKGKDRKVTNRYTKTLLEKINETH